MGFVKQIVVLASRAALNSNVKHIGLNHFTATNPVRSFGTDILADVDGLAIREDTIYDREFAEMQVEDFEPLYKDDTSGVIKSQVETVLKEYEFLKYNSMGRVPSKIDLIDMERIFKECPTPCSREKMIHYLFKREMIKKADQARRRRDRMEKRSIYEAKLEKLEKICGGQRTGLLTPSGDLIYGLWHNSLFCRISESKIKAGNSSSRLIQAAMFGRKLVFDFDFDNHMPSWVARNAIEQVQEAYGVNKHHYEHPFDLWFCNFNEKSLTGQYCVNNAIKNLHTTSSITVKNDCFTNYFDKSRLVYLSPHAKSRLEDVNNDDVYIIGVYNDKGSSKPLTYRKAVSMGIRCKCLPLDSYIFWQGGSKSLCINHVTGILLEVMANGGDWRQALTKHIPDRKMKPLEILVEEEEQRLSRLKQRKSGKRFSLRDDISDD